MHMLRNVGAVKQGAFGIHQPGRIVAAALSPGCFDLRKVEDFYHAAGRVRVEVQLQLCLHFCLPRSAFSG